MPKLKAGVIGATGYAGAELVRLLLSHPNVELAAVSSVSYEGKPLSEIYPSLAGCCDALLTNDQAVLQTSDVVFASLPHGHSEPYARACMEQGKVFIDLGADFRLYNEQDYRDWYGLCYADPALHQKAVYALPELYRDQIKTARLLGNPGCYPTSIALGLAPALKRRFIDANTLVLDSKSGVTGAGRGLSQNTHYRTATRPLLPTKLPDTGIRRKSSKHCQTYPVFLSRSPLCRICCPSTAALFPPCTLRSAKMYRWKQSIRRIAHFTKTSRLCASGRWAASPT